MEGNLISSTAAIRWLVSSSVNSAPAAPSLLLHVKVTDVVTHRVIYEFDMAGGSRGQGKLGTIRASGLGKATPFDLRNAAERVMLVLSPDPHRYGARSSVALR